jgi:hypothetical protein
MDLEQAAVHGQIPHVGHFLQRPINVSDGAGLFRSDERLPMKDHDISIVSSFIALHRRLVDECVATEIGFQVFRYDLRRDVFSLSFVGANGPAYLVLHLGDEIVAAVVVKVPPIGRALLEHGEVESLERHAGGEPADGDRISDARS